MQERVGGGLMNLCKSFFINHVWQFCLEIEGYFVAYFDRIAVFEAPYH